jgi:hypothetical protein
MNPDPKPHDTPSWPVAEPKPGPDVAAIVAASTPATKLIVTHAGGLSLHTGAPERKQVADGAAITAGDCGAYLDTLLKAGAVRLA